MKQENEPNLQELIYERDPPMARDESVPHWELAPNQLQKEHQKYLKALEREIWLK